jgi:NTP pyrophosphatase (non-canonical NTP hydrolase)
MANKLTLQQVVDDFRQVYREFEKYEGRKWTPEVIVVETAKQVGDLAKLVMVKENYYFVGRKNYAGYQSDKDKIGDEIVDIISQLIRLADAYDIDLESAINETRKGERASLKEIAQQSAEN